MLVGSIIWVLFQMSKVVYGCCVRITSLIEMFSYIKIISSV
jgi:hypothetical protein